MFSTIARLLFGAPQESPEDVNKCGDVVDEGWLVIGHQDANSDSSSPEMQETEVASSQLTNFTRIEDIPKDISLSDPELPAQSGITASEAIADSAAQARALAKMAQISCVQRAKAWADQHQMSRNVIKRQNQTRQSSRHQFFHLHQPVHRNLGH